MSEKDNINVNEMFMRKMQHATVNIFKMKMPHNSSRSLRLTVSVLWLNILWTSLLLPLPASCLFIVSKGGAATDTTDTQTVQRVGQSGVNLSLWFNYSLYDRDQSCFWSNMIAQYNQRSDRNRTLIEASRSRSGTGWPKRTLKRDGRKTHGQWVSTVWWRCWRWHKIRPTSRQVMWFTAR